MNDEYEYNDDELSHEYNRISGFLDEYFDYDDIQEVNIMTLSRDIIDDCLNAHRDLPCITIIEYIVRYFSEIEHNMLLECINNLYETNFEMYKLIDHDSITMVSGDVELNLNQFNELLQNDYTDLSFNDVVSVPLLSVPDKGISDIDFSNNVKPCSKESECLICYEDINENGSEIINCKHSFHTQCLKEWSKVSQLCPLCKNSIISQ